MCGPVAHVLAIQSYDFITATSGDGSISRINSACDWMWRGFIPKDAYAVWPQGFQETNPSVQTHPGQESLGQNLANYAGSLPIMHDLKVLCRPMSWTTRRDILASYQLVQEIGYEQAVFYFVSDPVHLRRVRLTWWMTHPKGWEAIFLSAPAHKMSWKERLIREPVALAYYFVALLPALFA